MKKSYKAPEIQAYVFETNNALLSGSKIPVNQEEYSGNFQSRDFAFDEDEDEDEEVW